MRCRIWICYKKFTFFVAITVSVNLAFLRKFGSFWALLHWQHLVGESFFDRNWTSIWLQNCLLSFSTSVTSAKVLKKSQISSKNATFILTLTSKEKLNFLLQIHILHFNYVWNLPSLSLAWFFLIQNELWTMCFGLVCWKHWQ